MDIGYYVSEIIGYGLVMDMSNFFEYRSGVEKSISAHL